MMNKSTPQQEDQVAATLTYQEINACSFDQWSTLFDNVRPRVTLQSTVIPLSQDFITYLKEDGIILPKSIALSRAFRDDDDDEFKDEGQDEGEFSREFPEVQQSIAEAIEEYGGAVFPKLNWSSPRDAQWILSDSKLLKCTSVEDVFLVLKSSQFITHDLDDAYSNVKEGDLGEDLPRILVLRKWFDIQPSMEFRCFVRNRNLVAISQRDDSNFYDFLRDKKIELCDKITQFWHQTVESKFALENYTMDVYVARNGSIYIIDFNVYGPPTQSLLFDWNQKPLNDISTNTENVEMRIVESRDCVMRPSLKMYGAIPSDFFDPSNAESSLSKNKANDY